MESIKDLIGLLMFQLQNLYSAKEQQLQILPSIIKKAHYNSLRNALTHHLELTKEQKSRLEKIPRLIDEKINLVGVKDIVIPAKEFSSEYQNKGMQGLVEEVNELLGCGLSEDVNDAAIISAVQKMEHYEICTYGTALAYASQLHLRSVEALLNETLNEEYDADDLLTALATASLNKEAEPEGAEALKQVADLEVDEENGETEADLNSETKVTISERTVNSPGGRAGTSHRRYPSGESRGH